ncbi:TadE/TadG family type IV pilus assembly protein [Advenella sp. RU8]|uniref:TadE/TadG family type IV pilus assembly protein n=1 Tax=Advenella sp. RU8 TaxID=3399575 RepID=UPI003AB00DC3
MIKSHLPKHGQTKNNKGFGSVEFLLVAAPLLMLGMGSIEASYWYITRQASSLALFEAARAAATSHANPQNIEQAFEKALQPLFVPAGNFTSPSARMLAYFSSIQKKTGLAPWRIVIKNPNQADFIDFQRKDLPISQQTGLPAIDNNYQYEQHQRSGTGTFSGHNIFQANTLQIELTYPYRALIPGLGQLFRLLADNQQDYDKQLMRQGILPIKQTLSISMQSHPVLWPVEANGKVLYSHTPASGNGIDSSHTQGMPTCSGLWCELNTRPIDAPIPSETTLPDNPLNTIPDNQQVPSPNETGNNSPTASNEPLPEEGISVDGKDPACGVTLCCT